MDLILDETLIKDQTKNNTGRQMPDLSKWNGRYMSDLLVLKTAALLLVVVRSNYTVADPTI